MNKMKLKENTTFILLGVGLPGVCTAISLLNSENAFYVLLIMYLV